MDNEHGFQNHKIVMNFDTWVEIMNLNQLKTIKCTFFHNFTWMQTIVEYTFKCNFNVHNDYKFVMCKKFQWNIYQGNLHILTMKVNEEDDHM
jgi:hypothetical protein